MNVHTSPRKIQNVRAGVYINRPGAPFGRGGVGFLASGPDMDRQGQPSPPTDGHNRATGVGCFVSFVVLRWDHRRDRDTTAGQVQRVECRGRGVALDARSLNGVTPNTSRPT